MIFIIKKLYAAMKNTWKGLKNVVSDQWAFRFELVILCIAFPLALYVQSTMVEFILLISSLLLLLIVEILNSAIEVTINRIGLEFHELSGLAKDLGSAAVFMATVYAIFVWSMLLFQCFFR